MIKWRDQWKQTGKSILQSLKKEKRRG